MRYISIIILNVFIYTQMLAQWQTTNFPSTLKVNTIAIRDSVIYAGTDGEGIFISNDNGDSWDNINKGLQSKVIHTLFIAGNSIYAGTETGVSVSTNNGLSWNTINSGLSAKSVWSFASASDLAGGETIYAGTWSGVYSSADSGAHWQATGLSYTSMPVHSIKVYKNYIFAATLAGGIFRSTDTGVSWDDCSITDIDLFSDTFTILPVCALGLIGNSLTAGLEKGLIYYVEAERDTTFNYSIQKNSKQKPVICFTNCNDRLYAADLIGDIYESNNNASAWNLIIPDFQVPLSLYSIAVNNSFVFAGTGKGIWRSGYQHKNLNPDNITETADRFDLQQNYPNPFNASTKIKFNIQYSGRVSLKVYNALGKLIDNLFDGYMNPGIYEVDYSAGNLPSGIYFYSLVTDKFRSTKKFILMK